MNRKNTKTSKQSCIIGKYCSFHDFVHGAEAEEIRSKLIELISKLRSYSFDREDQFVHYSHLEDLLNSIDARDSVAYLGDCGKK